jgi:hypothetical protein
VWLVKFLLLSTETGRGMGNACASGGYHGLGPDMGVYTGTKLSNFFRLANLSQGVGIEVEANS